MRAAVHAREQIFVADVAVTAASAYDSAPPVSFEAVAETDSLCITIGDLGTVSVALCGLVLEHAVCMSFDLPPVLGPVMRTHDAAAVPPRRMSLGIREEEPAESCEDSGPSSEGVHFTLQLEVLKTLPTGEIVLPTCATGTGHPDPLLSPPCLQLAPARETMGLAPSVQIASPSKGDMLSSEPAPIATTPALVSDDLEPTQSTSGVDGSDAACALAEPLQTIYASALTLVTHESFDEGAPGAQTDPVAPVMPCSAVAEAMPSLPEGSDSCELSNVDAVASIASPALEASAGAVVDVSTNLPVVPQHDEAAASALLNTQPSLSSLSACETDSAEMRQSLCDTRASQHDTPPRLSHIPTPVRDIVVTDIGLSPLGRLIFEARPTEVGIYPLLDETRRQLALAEVSKSLLYLSNTTFPAKMTHAISLLRERIATSAECSFDEHDDVARTTQLVVAVFDATYSLNRITHSSVAMIAVLLHLAE